MEEYSPCCLHLLGLAWFKQFVYLLLIQKKDYLPVPTSTVHHELAGTFIAINATFIYLYGFYHVRNRHI